MTQSQPRASERAVAVVRGAQRGARLVEYAPWLARDYLTNQGPATGIVVLLVGITTVVPAIQGLMGGRASFGQIPLDLANNMLRVIVTPLAFIGVLFSTNGIVANDRKLGYYRFLFAKPVSPPWYYATAFLVHGLGLLVISLAIAGIWYVAVRPEVPLKLLLVVAIIYVAYGGVGFLLSAAWRFDWLSLVTVMLVANVGWTVWGKETGIRHSLLYLLPPVHRDDDVYGMVVRSASVPWESIAWLMGYGIICFVLGMIVIRRRPLGTS